MRYRTGPATVWKESSSIDPTTWAFSVPPPLPRVVELGLPPAPGEVIAPRIRARPSPAAALGLLDISLPDGPLVVAVIGREHQPRPVGHVDADRLEARVVQVARHEVADRMVPLAERGLAPLTCEIEADVGGSFLDWRGRVDARLHQEHGMVVRLGGHDQAARLGDPRHLSNHGRWVGHVHEHRLACDQVEAPVLERQRLGGGLVVREPIGEARLGRAARRLLDPPRLAIDADERHVGRHHGAEEPAPVPDAGADVEDRAHPVKAEPPRAELQVVCVPPVVPQVAEVRRLVELVGFGSSHGRIVAVQ
jgi:hypothetical protein